MPVTPVFHLDQDAEFVYITIRVPYVRVSDMELEVEGTKVDFFCKPYLLKLTLPGQVVDDERAKTVYDVNRDNGTLIIHLPKMTPGTDFPDLDMVTKLMAPKSSLLNVVATDNGYTADQVRKHAPYAPLIQIVDDSNDEEDDGDDDDDEDAATAPGPAADGDTKEGGLDEIFVGAITYGFNGGYSGVFTHLEDEVALIVDVPTPEKTSPAARTRLRLEDEDTSFEAERYQGDYAAAAEDYLYCEALRFEPHWSSSEEVTLTEEERERLAKLPRKEFLIARGSAQEQSVLCGLADVLAAFAYDQRITQDPPTTVTQATRNSVRRMLCFPYMRHWQLAMVCLNDVTAILRKGRRCALRCLLSCLELFKRDDSRYILNTIVIQDWCIWLQHVSDESFARFAQTHGECVKSFTKSDVGWDLHALEAEVDAVLNGEADEEDMLPAELSDMIAAQAVAAARDEWVVAEEEEEEEEEDEDEDEQSTTSSSSSSQSEEDDEGSSSEEDDDDKDNRGNDEQADESIQTLSVALADTHLQP